MLSPADTKIRSLGPCRFTSPLKLSTVHGDGVVNFVPDEVGMPWRVERVSGAEQEPVVTFEKAGPRQRLFFDPARTTAAVVTCGGLCPGLNNVIRSIVMELHYHYGAKKIWGIRCGYMGLDPTSGMEPIELTPALVEDIHKEGGSFLGSSRGPVEPAVAFETLERLGVNILFCVGGDGTQRGAHAIEQEARARGSSLAVVGIPKTIDNDIPFVWRTFGYDTAVHEACEVIACAHAEAKGAPNGITVVKLMGRHAGYIAAGATVASQDVNFTLVPEVPFELEGPRGLLELLHERIRTRHHAVIVVAEGAGQHLLARAEVCRDASGNVLNADIGPVLRDGIQEYFREQRLPVNVRYIDPSYLIRSVPANSSDALLCDQFARRAVHAGMAGRTGLLIGYWYNVFIHVPIELAVSRAKQMSPESELWAAVLEATGQPVRIGGPGE